MKSQEKQNLLNQEFVPPNEGDEKIDVEVEDYQDGDNISNDNKRNRKSSKKETKSNKKTKH